MGASTVEIKDIEPGIVTVKSPLSPEDEEKKKKKKTAPDRNISYTNEKPPVNLKRKNGNQTELSPPSKGPRS